MSVWLERAAAIILGLALAALPFLHARYGIAGHDHHHHAGGSHAYHTR
jgi:hypothetical protein